MRNLTLLITTSILLGIAGDSFGLSSGNYRWRNDDGTETTATWKAAENTTTTLAASENIRLRMDLYESTVTYTDNYSLQYSTSASGPWTDITTNAANHFVLTNSAFFTDGDPTTDLAGLTNTGPFVATGKLYDATNPFTFTTSNTYQSSEFEFCFKATANAIPGQLYYFNLGGSVFSPPAHQITLTYSPPCSAPDVPSPTASLNNVCASTSVTLDWSGDTLNDATNWHIYTGSCGVTQLTTTTGNSIVVSPDTTTTYYIRGEDGAGCVDESTGLCGSITVTVKPSTTGTLDSTICNGSSFVFNGTIYDGTNNSGTETLTAANLCDSVVTVTVTELPAIDTSTSLVNQTITSNEATGGTTYRWLDCNNVNAVITDSTNQVFNASANGSYAVEITVGSCVDTSACKIITGVGIKEQAEAVVSIYPNPTSGIFTISLNNNNSLVNYTITTIEGRIVENGKTSSNLISVDLNNESKGVYFIQVRMETTSNVYRLIKQ